MRNLRIIDREAQQIDYHLNILGVRVWKSACQLIARAEGKWTSIGPNAVSRSIFPSDRAVAVEWSFRYDTP